MANATTPFGLRPVRHIWGAPWNGATVPMFLSADYGTAAYIGDPILYSPTAAEDDTTNVNNYPKINVSAATDAVIVVGCIVSFDALKTDLTKNYNPASTERIAHCCIDPSVVYQIRGCGGGTPATDWIQRNAVGYNAGGSTVTGYSGFHLDEGTSAAPAANQSYPFLIVGRSTDPNNSLADYCVWEVVLNTWQNVTGAILGVSDA